MADLKWSLSTSETIFETQSKGLVVQKRVYLCEDGRTKTVELKHEGPFGHIFAVTRDNKVILVRQFRVGPDKYFYESPAGSLKSGDPKEEVLRELKEETGYISNDIELLRAGHDGAYTTAMRYMFIARDCIKATEQHLDSDEYIDEVYLASFKEVKNFLRNGEYQYPLLAYLAFEHLGVLKWGRSR